MRAPLTDAELDGRLALLGLERDPTVTSPPPSKNRTVVCRSGRKRVLVKIADGPGNVGVLREGSVLQRVQPLAHARSSPLHLPHVYAFDPANGLLALDWIHGGETLHHHHRTTLEYAPVLARQVGHALGFLHLMSKEDRARFALADAFRDESDLLECFLRMRPDFYARLSQVAIDFFASVQADAPAMQGLQALSEAQLREGDAVLLHGDLRQANLLRVGRGKTANIVFLDWELSFWGDAARDLGSLLSDYVLGWLAPEHRSEVLARPTLAGFARSMMLAYAEARGAGFAFDAAFQERVVRWVGAALLIYVYGISHYEQVLDARALGVGRHALDMLGRPGDWPTVLWGGQ
ncbi:MAG: phosphotransferase [Actinobacteria bacterium]|nr:phosphotransferase [Actinomycetota bacterium]